MLLAAWLVQVYCCYVVGNCRLWYVSQIGHDDHHCGGESTPCRTINFAISHSTWHDIINIDPTRGPYINESRSNHTHITHTLTLTSVDGKGRAAIDCQSPQESSLFYVHQAATAPVNAKVPILTLNRITVRNCRQSNSLDDSTIMAENAYVKIVDSEFLSNGVLLYHPWTANTTCNSMQLYIANSTFKFNQLSHPYRPGISLRSCTSVHMITENTTFTATPILIDGAKDLSINFQTVSLDGANSKTVALYLTLADDTNQIVMSNSVVRGHHYSKNSAIVVAVNQDTTQTPIVHMNRVIFMNNWQAKTMGSALSVFARFRRDKPIPVGLKLSNCQFVNNSALHDAGAIYLENVCAVHISGCMFTNNTGITGGAIYVKSGSDIVFTNTNFHGNHAAHPTDANYMTLGGAMYASSAKLVITNCSFVDNSAALSAQALYIVGAPYLVIQQSYFKDNSNYHASPQNTIVFIDSQSDSTYRMDPDTQLTNNVFNVTMNSQCASMMNVKARVSEKGNNFWCPHGHHVEMQNIGAPFQAKYSYAHALYWCRACPPDTYSLHRGHLSNSTPNYGVCIQCPQKGYCQNGRITTRANHWGFIDKDYQLQFSVCPEGMCCGQDHCNTFRACATRRRGVLCGSCVQHHVVALGNRACVPELSCVRFTYALLVIVVFGMAYILVFLMLQMAGPSISMQVQGLTTWISSRILPCCKKCRKSDDQVPITDTDDNPLEGALDAFPTDASVWTETEAAEMATIKQHIVNTESALKITFQFYQILPIVYQMSMVDDVSHSITQTLTDIFYLRPFFSILGTFCSPPQLGNSGVLLVYLLAAALPMMVICVVYLLGYITLCILRCVRKTPTTMGESHAHQVLKLNCIGLFLYIMLFSYVPLLRAGFGLLNCVHVGDQHVLYVDSSVVCMQPWQMVLAVFIVVTLALQWLVLAIGLPLLRAEEIPSWQFILATILPLPMLAWWMWKLGLHSIKSGFTTYTTDQITLAHVWRVVDITETPFVDGTHKNVTRWQSVLLFHALTIVGLSEFLVHVPVVRALVLIVACVVALAVHANWRPFVNTTANRVQTITLCTLTIFSVFNMHRAVLYSMGLLPTGSNKTLFDVYDWSYIAVSLWLPVMIGVGLLLLATRGLVKLTMQVARVCCGQQN